MDNDIKKVIVYYIDITDKVEIMNFIKEDDSTTLEIELRDLKSILDDVVIGDYAESTKKLQADMLLLLINLLVIVCCLKLQNSIRKHSLILLRRNRINRLKSVKKAWNLLNSLVWIALRPVVSGILIVKSRLIKMAMLS